MCDSLNNHSHEHGVRSDTEKALGDLRDNFSEKLKSITKYEAQVALIKESSFSGTEAVSHLLQHILEDEKKNAAALLKQIFSLDKQMSEIFEHKSSHHH